ncbi:hypothetical protein Tco_1207818, partial [Tanacetum coccineum]
TKSDVLEITSSYRKRSANQQLDSHVFQMQTQLAGWNVRPQFLSNFLDTGIATSVGIMQSLHNQSTDSIFLHTEDRRLQVELLLPVVALVAQIQLLVTVVKAPVLVIMKNIPRRFNSKMHSEGDDSPITKLSNTVKGTYKFGMEIPDIMIDEAFKKSAGYKYYKAKKVESGKAKAAEKPEE